MQEPLGELKNKGVCPLNLLNIERRMYLTSLRDIVIHKLIALGEWMISILII